MFGKNITVASINRQVTEVSDNITSLITSTRVAIAKHCNRADALAEQITEERFAATALREQKATLISSLDVVSEIKLPTGEA